MRFLLTLLALSAGGCAGDATQDYKPIPLGDGLMWECECKSGTGTYDPADLCISSSCMEPTADPTGIQNRSESGVCRRLGRDSGECTCECWPRDGWHCDTEDPTTWRQFYLGGSCK